MNSFFKFLSRVWRIIVGKANDVTDAIEDPASTGRQLTREMAQDMSLLRASLTEIRTRRAHQAVTPTRSNC